jgi:hypothetical protein
MFAVQLGWLDCDEIDLTNYPAWTTTLFEDGNLFIGIFQ